MATRGRPKGSKNAPKFPLDDKQVKAIYKDKELDRLKNLVSRQDDVIAQLQDDLKDHKNTCEVLRDECGQLEEKIESYREILKTILEITE